MSPVIFEIGPLQIRWYGLMYVVAIIVGIFLTYREVRRRGLPLNLDDILDFVLITIPIAIVTARLYYVAFQWEYYSQNPHDIYRIWQGGLAIHGGLIGGAFALWIFSRWKRVSFLGFADLIVPAVVLGQALGRFGNFMNGDAYGTPTDLPWAMYFPADSPAGQQYCPGTLSRTCEIGIHPSMLYELLGCLIIFGVLWWLRTKPFKEGFLLSLYALLYSALRFVVEFTRGDALCLLGGDACVRGAATFLESLRTAQVISVLIFVGFAALMLTRKLYLRAEPEDVRPAS